MEPIASFLLAAIWLAQQATQPEAQRESNLGFLFAAFFIAWLVLGLYLWNLSGRISGLRRELEALKRRDAEQQER